MRGLIESDGSEGGIVALFASGHDVLDFGVGGSDLTDAVDVVSMGYDDNLVDAIVLMKSSDRVLQDGAACYLYELFGLWSAHAPATAAGKKYGYVHWFFAPNITQNMLFAKQKDEKTEARHIIIFKKEGNVSFFM